MQEIWKSKVSWKIKHFAYHAGRGRIPCAFQLVKRNWKGGDDKCKLCGAPENVNHVLFNCPITIFDWCVIKEVLNFPVIPVVYRIISLLQRWRLIQRRKEEVCLEQLIKDLMTKLQQLRPSGRLPDDLDFS
ncbi:Os05g0372050 [Oryza sativa Japonica Group]|uniref:Os05g0372050 protein n=1 Tax=Oryza sativa subsp. japonica TaxID=39947 RepID=A0A0P0WLJ9_ORYSJ|nr:Os05g0372050 [Oryza sativa Japonica Group]